MQQKSSKSKSAGNGGYHAKRSGGRQMYGPGCCAHTITPQQINNAKKEAQKRGHFKGNYWGGGTDLDLS